MPTRKTEPTFEVEQFARASVSQQVHFAVRDLVFNWAVVVATAISHHAAVKQVVSTVPQGWSALLIGLLSLPAFVIIASRQHALLGLMHEAAHRHLLPGKWNDFVSDLFCAMPLFLVTRFYRLSHLVHHQFLNSPDDPDWSRKTWSFPKKSAFEFWAFVFRESTAAVGRRLKIFVMSVVTQPKYSLGFFFYLITIEAFLAALVWIGIGWQNYILYWLGPMVLVLPVLGIVRSVSEHFGLNYAGDLNQARDINAGPIEKALFGPNAIHLHLTHHLYPGVPRYRLESLHNRLREEPWFSGAKQNSSYIFPSEASVLGDIISAEYVVQEKH